MPFKAAIVELKGKSISVFLVHRKILSCPEKTQKAFERLRRQFPHLPICLAAKSLDGQIAYHATASTRDLLGDLNLEAVDWMDLEGEVA